MSDGNVRVPTVDLVGKEIDCLVVTRAGGDRYIQRVALADHNGGLITDSIGHSIVTTDIDHYLIHAGKTWVASNIVTVAGTTAFDILVTNISTYEIHIKDFLFSSQLATASLVIYSTPTVSGNGIPQVLRNKNFSHQVDTPLGALYISPTVTSVGAPLEYFQFVGSKQSGGTVQGGGDEWVLPANGKLLFRYTNNAAQTDTICYTIKLLDIN